MGPRKELSDIVEQTNATKNTAVVERMKDKKAFARQFRSGEWLSMLTEQNSKLKKPPRCLGGNTCWLYARDGSVPCMLCRAFADCTTSPQ